MTEEEKVRKELEQQLEKVIRRLAILDMIEEKLYTMKVLSQKGVDENLSKEEVLEINKEVNNLGDQVKLLDMEVTEIS